MKNLNRVFRRAGVATAALTGLVFFFGCDRTATGPLRQRGYLWQREWSPAVADAVREARKRSIGVVILGAEIVWKGKQPEVVAASIDWRTLREQGVSCSIALRVAPVPRMFEAGDGSFDLIEKAAQSLLQQAQEHGITLEEFQFDFDCPQKELSKYRSWLRRLRPIVHPVKLVVTTLPAWLDELEFVRLVEEADSFVLQVHSVPISSEPGRALLCDPRLARKWALRAAKSGKPFAVALPTYRCAAGYAPTGKLLGVAMDSVQPVWPPGTRILEFEPDADAMAQLVGEWETSRPANLRGLIWYRLPVASDLRNWRWPTLAAVMAGRQPLHKLEALPEGENPIDIVIANNGEAEEQLDATVIVSWNGPAPVAADALNGWMVDPRSEQAVFATVPDFRIRLAPGARHKIGWLRFGQPTSLRLQLARQHEAPR